MKVKVFLQALKATKNTIFDHDEVNAYLDSLFDKTVTYSQRVIDWVYGKKEKNFRGSRIVNALTNSSETAKAITNFSIRPTDPDWVRKNIEDDKPVYRLKIPDSNDAVTLKYKKWIDFLEARLREATEKGMRYNLEALTPEDLPRIIEQYEKEHPIEEKYSDKGTQIIKVYTGKEGKRIQKGFHWVRLLTRDALEKEGDIMNNCIGSLHIEDILEGRELAYSLRSRNNHPWVDLSFMLSDGIIREDTLRGPNNSDISGKFRPYVIDLLMSKKDMKVMRMAFIFSKFKQGAITIKNVDSLDYLEPEDKRRIKNLISKKFRGSKLIPYKEIDDWALEGLGADKKNGKIIDLVELALKKNKIFYQNDNYKIIQVKNGSYTVFINENGKCSDDALEFTVKYGEFILDDVDNLKKFKGTIIDILNDKFVAEKLDICSFDNVDRYGIVFDDRYGKCCDINTIDDSRLLYKCDNFKVFKPYDNVHEAFYYIFNADNLIKLDCKIEGETKVVKSICGNKDDMTLTENNKKLMRDFFTSNLEKFELDEKSFKELGLIESDNKYYSQDKVSNPNNTNNIKVNNINTKIIFFENKYFIFVQNQLWNILDKKTGTRKYLDHNVPFLLDILRTGFINLDKVDITNIIRFNNNYYHLTYPERLLSYDDIPDSKVLYKGCVDDKYNYKVVECEADGYSKNCYLIVYDNIAWKSKPILIHDDYVDNTEYDWVKDKIILSLLRKGIINADLTSTSNYLKIKGKWYSFSGYNTDNTTEIPKQCCSYVSEELNYGVVKDDSSKYLIIFSYNDRFFIQFDIRNFRWVHGDLTCLPEKVKQDVKDKQLYEKYLQKMDVWVKNLILGN